VPEATAEAQTILKRRGASRPPPPGTAPQRFVEPRFINEIVSSGFADAFYRERQLAPLDLRFG
jgi:hypothetical protein